MSPLLKSSKDTTAALATSRMAGLLLMISAGVSTGIAVTVSGQVADDQSAKSMMSGPAIEGPAFYVREYRVRGAKILPRIDVEAAVYPFMGAGRTASDVEQARAALEKAYKDKGFETVSVVVPDPTAYRGIVLLQVVEAPVGRLRVRGSRYFDLNAIKRKVPSLAEGKVPNFNEVSREIIALNQWADRRVKPSLQPGVEPNTYDIDLTVTDTFPLHGSIELNNRYSADTTELRLNSSISYTNLWQLGHSAGLSFQVAPENPDDAKVFSAFYTARIPNVDWLTIMLLGTKQDSNVSTLGGAAVAGRGEILGIRGNIALPSRTNAQTGAGFYQSVSLGLDYKRFDENIILRDTGLVSAAPIAYYPISVNYNGTWAGKKATTELNSSVVFGIRGAGSDQKEFDTKRFKSDESFIYFRGDLAHTRDLPKGFELYAKVQGQLASMPLVNSEQFAGGGLGTVRGYLESTALGDNGLFGSLELRTPSLIPKRKPKPVEGAEATLDDTVKIDEPHEWRLYAFLEGGHLTINEPLPEQQDGISLASVGLGTRVRLFDHFNGSLDAGFPLITRDQIQAHELLLTFRMWADF